MKLFLEDTIVAPATKISKQAISIIRVSGNDTFKIVNSLLDKDLVEDNKQQLRRIYDNNILVDESLILTFTKGKSFTGEDTVEINCHGGVLVTNKIIRLIISKGARMAQPGEFSQRAYMNGKISLLQAEGINNLIEAKNDLALKINAKSMAGINDDKLISIKDKLIDVISKIQTSIDYPDYDDIEGSTPEEIKSELVEVDTKIEKILDLSKRALKINEGIKTLILGEPNVGKSSLLNAMLNEEKAIVTDIEGTTRDIVEGTINFESFSLNLIDTAGIRNTNDKVEQIGIEKSLKLIDQADLILYVVDNDNINMELEKKLENKNFIKVFNKSDLNNNINKKPDIVYISAINNEIDALLEKIKELLQNEEILESDLPLITNINSIAQVENLLEIIKEIVKNIDLGFDLDILVIELYKALDIINNLLGVVDADEEVIDNIFKKYCLGK
ncbi:tRNA modification GTPase [Spiroplasma chinense]|uniref:tRNA modification GTPase MnmE n=1 Tax=Spiroplasma chinense TaxID=216932 RepID=A0A5B9Y6Q2_9MOLU|nr:tRNA uridine-5-carboxymethylaminomethyl(34) synthesis GTPase MnmE [Spiroplasma chinense]QEH62416.1 tRNA modification GTPase [Spiroplasma chinense]